MAKKQFKSKKLNLKEHRSRLLHKPAVESSSLSWVVAFGAVTCAILLFLFQH